MTYTTASHYCFVSPSPLSPTRAHRPRAHSARHIVQEQSQVTQASNIVQALLVSTPSHHGTESAAVFCSSHAILHLSTSSIHTCNHSDNNNTLAGQLTVGVGHTEMGSVDTKGDWTCHKFVILLSAIRGYTVTESRTNYCAMQCIEQTRSP